MGAGFLAAGCLVAGLLGIAAPVLAHEPTAAARRTETLVPCWGAPSSQDPGLDLLAPPPEAASGHPVGGTARAGAALLATPTRLLVGAPHWSHGSSRAGAVLERRGAHGLELLLEAPQGEPGDHYGASLAAGSGWLAVGAPLAGPSHAGRVHVLEDDERSAPRLEAVIERPDLGLLAGFGSALAGEDDLLLAGAPRAGGVAASLAGAVLCFRRAPSRTWGPIPVEAPRPHPGDERGASVAMGPHHAAVGAPGAGLSGEVLLWDRLGGTLVGCRRVLPPNSGTPDRFGEAVALSGEWLAVGAPGVPGSGASGAIHTFHIDPWGLSPGPVFQLPGTGALGLGTRITTCAEGFLAAAPAGPLPRVVRIRIHGGGGGPALDGAWSGEPGTGFGLGLAQGPSGAVHIGVPGAPSAPAWLLRHGGGALVRRSELQPSIQLDGAFPIAVRAWTDGGVEAVVDQGSIPGPIGPAPRFLWEGLPPLARTCVSGGGEFLSSWAPVRGRRSGRLRVCLASSKAQVRPIPCSDVVGLP